MRRSTAKIAGAQSSHGLFRAHAQRGKRGVKRIPFRLDILDASLRLAILADLIDTVVHFRNEHVQVFDIGAQLAFFLRRGGLPFYG